MKKTFLIFVAFLSLATLSCKKDKSDSNSINDNLPALDAKKVTDWLVVDGATKVSGNPPAPNGATAPTITVGDKNATGIVDEGFYGLFSTTGNYTGAYVKVKGADSYLNIPLNSNNRINKNKSLGKNNQRTTEEDDLDIFFGLSNASEAGTFCYEICLYDAANQISNIVEVCVTINNFGGNDQLAGKWQYFIFDEYNSSNVLVDSDTTIYGGEVEDYCYNYDQNIDINFTRKEHNWIELMSNGDYTDNYKSTFIYNDTVSLLSLCEDLYYYNNEDYFKYTGKWSYNPNTNKVIMLDKVEYSSFGSPEQSTETYDPPSLYLDATLVSVNSSTLVLKQLYPDGSYELYTFIKF
jgi:hypothetical protein